MRTPSSFYKKTLVLSILLFIVVQANAQRIHKYYNYKWEIVEPAAAHFYSLITGNDSGYHRTDYFARQEKLRMSGNYEDIDCKIPSGHFEYYYANGVLDSIGNCAHGKKEGLWLSYYSNKMMKDSAFYVHGRKTGTSLKWHKNGYLRDSSITNVDGSGLQVTWFDNGVPSSVGKYSAGHKMTGKWQFYHKNGKLSSSEDYLEDRLIHKQYFDEEGNAVSDTTDIDRLPVFPGGMEAWSKYMEKSIYFPTDYIISNATKAVTVVSFTIDENGNVGDVFVIVPFDPAFDFIAERAFKKSPRWMPGVENHRNVKVQFYQPVVFTNYIRERDGGAR